MVHFMRLVNMSSQTEPFWEETDRNSPLSCTTKKKKPLLQSWWSRNDTPILIRFIWRRGISFHLLRETGAMLWPVSAFRTGHEGRKLSLVVCNLLQHGPVPHLAAGGSDKHHWGHTWSTFPNPRGWLMFQRLEEHKEPFAAGTKLEMLQCGQIPEQQR